MFVECTVSPITPGGQNNLTVGRSHRPRARAMIDSGATGIFMNKQFIISLGWRTRQKRFPLRLTMFNGEAADAITDEIEAVLYFNGLSQRMTFDVTNTGNFDIILGLPWLKRFNPNISWVDETIVIKETQIAEVKIKKTAEELVPEDLHGVGTRVMWSRDPCALRVL